MKVIIDRYKELFRQAVMLSMLVMSSVAFADSLPDKLTVAIIFKLIEYDERFDKRESVKVHVISSASIASVMAGYQGKRFNNLEIMKVTHSDKLPESEVDVIFIGGGKIKEIVDHARENRVLTVTNRPDYSKDGVSLIVFNDEGLPGILINTVSSGLEGVLWKPEVLDVARTIDEYKSDSL